MKFAKGIWFTIILLLTAIMAGVVWFMTSSYDDIIRISIEQLQRPDLKKLLEEQYFTREKHDLLQQLSYLAAPLLFALLVLIIFRKDYIVSILTDGLRSVKNAFLLLRKKIAECQRVTKLVLLLVVLTVLVRSLFFVLYFYPQYDECWNYNYFLSTNLWTSVFAYNNYPLHNILSFITLKFLPDNTFCMRLPNVFIGTFNILLVFVLCKQFFKNEKLALASGALFSVLPTTVFYMLFARGVMLALFFALLMLYYFLVKKIGEWSRTDRFILSIIGSLGCYAMISFPIFIAVLFLIYLISANKIKRRDAIRQILWVIFGIAIGSLMLYLPMILGTGMSLGIHSNYNINTLDWTAYFNKVALNSKNQIGYYIGSYIFLTLNAVLFFLSKRRKLLILNIGLLLLPFCLPLLLQIYLPARALGFQLFAYLFTLLIFLELAYNQFGTKALFALSVFMVLGFNYISTTHTFFDWSARRDKAAFEIAQVFQRRGIKQYYDLDGTFDYFVPSILYHHKIVGREIYFSTNDKKSTRYTLAENFEGNCFVISAAQYQSQPEHTILYEYKDEDQAFVVYQSLNRPAANP